MVTQVKVLQLLLSAEEEQLWEPVWCGISFMVCWGEVWKGYLPCSNKHWPSATGIHYLIENYIFRHMFEVDGAQSPWGKLEPRNRDLRYPTSGNTFNRAYSKTSVWSVLYIYRTRCSTWTQRHPPVFRHACLDFDTLLAAVSEGSLDLLCLPLSSS